MKPGDIVIYTPPYMAKEMPVKPVKAMVKNVLGDGKVLILVKAGTEYTKKRRVSAELLQKVLY